MWVAGFIGNHLFGVSLHVRPVANWDSAEPDIPIRIIDGIPILLPFPIDAVIIRVPVLFAEVVNVSRKSGRIPRGAVMIGDSGRNDTPFVLLAVTPEDDPARAEVICMVPDAAPYFFLKILCFIALCNLSRAQDTNRFSKSLFPGRKGFP